MNSAIYLLIAVVGTVVLYEAVAAVSRYNERQPKPDAERLNRIRIANQQGQPPGEIIY